VLWQALRASQGHACDSQRVLWFVLPDVELCKGAIVPTAFTTPRSPFSALLLSSAAAPETDNAAMKWCHHTSSSLLYYAQPLFTAGCPVDPRSKKIVQGKCSSRILHSNPELRASAICDWLRSEIRLK